MTNQEYIQSLDKRLKTILKRIALVSIMIRVDKSKSTDRAFKNDCECSRKCLGEWTRVLNWIRWSVRGMSTEEKLKRDPNFLDWFRHTITSSIQSQYKDVLKDFDITESLHPYSLHYRHVGFYSQSLVYNKIIKWLFGEVPAGLFGFFEDESSVLREEMRKHFSEELLKTDYENEIKLLKKE